MKKAGIILTAGVFLVIQAGMFGVCGGAEPAGPGGQMENLLSKVEATATAVLNKMNQVTAYSQQLAVLVDQLQALQEQKKELENQIEAHLTNKPQAPKRSSFPEGEPGQTAYDQALAQYNQALAQWNSQKSQLESNMTKLNGKIADTTGQIQQLKNARNAVKAQIKELMRQLENLQAEAQNVKQQHLRDPGKDPAETQKMKSDFARIKEKVSGTQSKYSRFNRGQEQK